MLKKFDLPGHDTTFKVEILAAITTFLTTSYIIIVNPIILSQAGMSHSAVVTATVLVSAFGSIMMGLFANNPIIVAPGMGINAFFTYTMVLGMGIKWQTALGAVFWAGVIFLILSLFNIREKIVNAIPKNLRYAISCGIGLFICLIGMVNSKFLISSPATVITHGKVSGQALIFVLGLLITVVMIAKNIKGGFLIAMLGTTILAAMSGRIFPGEKLVEWKGILAWPDFSLFFALDFWGPLKLAILPSIFAFIFTDLFDSLSTFMGIAQAGNLLDENGNPRNIKKSLIADSISTIFSGFAGSSPGTSFIESAAGIQQGGRTGLVAVFAGLLFLPFMFLSPLLSMVPAVATGPVLVMVGVFMMSPVTKINWKNMEDAIPAFVAMVLIPFSYSITYGIVWGFLTHTVIKIFQGKWSELPITLLVIDAFAIMSLVIK